MGRLKYDSSEPAITIDDETLVHLKIVIGTKLRRNESFLLTWLRGDDAEDARTTIWVHPAIPIQFGFDAAVLPPVGPERITTIMTALNATGELVLDEYLPAAAPATAPEPA
ncbi:hypothetical protein [Microbacterium sp.]|uniref:DUF7882 family protein n=1 Tax=Microbacterium sp. TaxID=51671 RepID=UPI0028AC699E|nr:hypothetical protein [Microbacterium sp.]